MKRPPRFLPGLLLGLVAFRTLAEPVLLSPPGAPFPGTAPLEMTGDIASNLVSGVHRFVDRQADVVEAARARLWADLPASGDARESALVTNRARLARLLGVVETRPSLRALEFVASTVQSSLVATSGAVRVDAIRWTAFGDVEAEGLLLQPADGVAGLDVVALPDADVTPEQLAGVEPGVAPESQFARRLAESGCRVVVPYLINRNKGESKVAWDAGRGRNLSNREYLHRAAFEMGRTLAGYEVTKIMAAVDGLRQDAPSRPVGVIGWGEGGRLALYAAALDTRLGACGVSGYFGPRGRVWQEPLDRNVQGLLERFGDAEIAALIVPRSLVIEAARGPVAEFASDGGAPGRLGTPDVAGVRAEFERARQRIGAAIPASRLVLVTSGEGTGAFGSAGALEAFLGGLRPGAALSAEGERPRDLRQFTDPRARADRQRRQIDLHTQRLLLRGADVRRDFLKGLDTKSAEAFAASQVRYREIFDREVIGRFEGPMLAPAARSRQAYDDPKWRGYEVVLDVFPDVIAYGLLLVPKDLKEGERRPVVVCQHGLEGRPQHVIGKEGSEYYSAFAAKLAERGFVTFAPQNLYLFRDRFRELQRKLNPLGKTLFSVITPQHQQIVDWLETIPFVDPQRIGFYGLSYGGKTAMRVPALVTDYCLSICSADFNEWVWKNASTDSPYSYVWTGEYEIFEWDLGHTFNYAEMAALIAPRPFMVERGHFDGVAPDETVGYEFGKVRHLYAARLKRPPEDCQLEWFVGPHSIHGVGTYEFLHRHLKWPAPGRQGD